MLLSKWLSGIFSRFLVYESRESGREIIPGMHMWAQLGIWGVGVHQISPPIGPCSLVTPEQPPQRTLTLDVASVNRQTSKNLSEDPSLTTCFFPGRDGVGGWG